ncbi:MAG: flavodoxin family protein [Thermoanaerobacteraceae bacterium]|nr:flavodoxin family protein [Thermoanaerobacteraceae bacterium]
MRTLIIFTSIHHGNTGKIAKVIAESLNADIIKTNEVNIEDIKNYDLIGFGSGIYYGKFHKNMFDLIDRLSDLKSKKAFVFSTSGFGSIKFNSFIEEKLKEKGIKVLGSFACKGFATYGPFKLIGGIAKNRPNNEDIQKAKDFANKVLKSLSG